MGAPFAEFVGKQATIAKPELVLYRGSQHRITHSSVQQPNIVKSDLRHFDVRVASQLNGHSQRWKPVWLSLRLSEAADSMSEEGSALWVS